jgi:hypothetical protein
LRKKTDESLGWLELLDALELSRTSELTWLLSEAQELLAIFSKSQKTAKENRQRQISVDPANRPINRQLPDRQSKII